MGVNMLHDNKCYLSASKVAKQQRAAAVAVVLASTAFIQCKFSVDFNKQARNNSLLTGQEWLDELLIGHPKRFYASMGMHKHVFQELLRELIKVGLHDTRYVSSEKQLAIFLYLAVTGVAQRHLEERFQCSPDTISKYVQFYTLQSCIDCHFQGNPSHPQSAYIRCILQLLCTVTRC
jgi:hypothetical protein